MLKAIELHIFKNSFEYIYTAVRYISHTLLLVCIDNLSILSKIDTGVTATKL